MTLDVLNLCSSIFGISGTLMLIKFGIPNKIDTGGAVSLISEQIDKEEIKEISRYKRLGKIGLFLILIGFFFQLLIGLGLNWEIPIQL